MLGTQAELTTHTYGKVASFGLTFEIYIPMVSVIFIYWVILGTR